MSLPTWCASHRCPFIADCGPTYVRCEKGGENVYLVDGQLADKPYERPAPNPKVDRKKQAEHDAQVIGEEQAKERSLLPGSFPRWLYGQRLEIDEQGHKKQPKPESSVFTVPFSPDELPSRDIPEPVSTESLITAIKEKVASTFKPPTCSECGSRLDTKPGICGNRAHLMRYEQSREASRQRKARRKRERSLGE